MAYEINDNKYRTLQRAEQIDIFNSDRWVVEAGTEIGSTAAFEILVTEAEYGQFKSLTPAECIDKKIELGYIELVI